MWSKQLFYFVLFALTILATQSRTISKRGILSKLFSSGSSSNNKYGTSSSGSGNSEIAPRERSKIRELLRNPIVVSMLTAAVGMVVQQALSTKNFNNICDNQYLKMATMASGLNPQIQQVLSMLGCTGKNKQDTNDKNNNKYLPAKNQNSTTPTNDEDEQEETNDDEDTLNSSLNNEKQSKLHNLLSVVKGEKGSKRKFFKSLFGLGKNKDLKPGTKLPQSSYKLDKSDSETLKNLEKELDQYNSHM